MWCRGQHSRWYRGARTGPVRYVHRTPSSLQLRLASTAHSTTLARLREQRDYRCVICGHNKHSIRQCALSRSRLRIPCIVYTTGSFPRYTPKISGAGAWLHPFFDFHLAGAFFDSGVQAVFVIIFRDSCNGDAIFANGNGSAGVSAQPSSCPWLSCQLCTSSQSNSL